MNIDEWEIWHQNMLKNDSRSKWTKFSDFLGKSFEEIKNHRFDYIYIDDDQIFLDNKELFLKIIEAGGYTEFISKNFEILKQIEDLLPDLDKQKEKYDLYLEDDLEIKDRSYVDLSYFKKSSITIPLGYTLWDAKINKKQAISYGSLIDKHYPKSCSGLYYLNSEQIAKLKYLISDINQKFGKYNNLEKIILISNYLQNIVQFVDCRNISESAGKIYITDSNGIEVSNNVGSPLNVLYNHFGVCEGIALASHILLSNPMMNVNTGCVSSLEHVWNWVEIDGKKYYFDNTWCITRNHDRYFESLKARSFDSNYLLFGNNMAQQIGHHNPKTIIPQIEDDNYPREVILESQKKLARTFSFSDYEKPVFNSHLQE